MHICPQADPFDGLLDVTIIHPVGRLKLLRLLPGDVLRAGSSGTPVSNSSGFAR